MKTYYDLQLFAEGEGEGEGQQTAAENTPEAQEKNGKEENNDSTAAPEEKTGDEIDTREISSGNEGVEPEGEADKTPGNREERLLQSLETALNEKLRSSEIKRITDDWVKSGEELREIYPGFDLKAELEKNADFRELLKAGVSVRRAYETANLEKILGSALRYAAVTAGKKTAQSFMNHSGRVQENSVLDRASSLSRKDVNSLTKNDILKILDEVSRGATIKF